MVGAGVEWPCLSWGGRSNLSGRHVCCVISWFVRPSGVWPGPLLLPLGLSLGLSCLSLPLQPFPLSSFPRLTLALERPISTFRLAYLVISSSFGQRFSCTIQIPHFCFPFSFTRFIFTPVSLELGRKSAMPHGVSVNHVMVPVEDSSCSFHYLFTLGLVCLITQSGWHSHTSRSLGLFLCSFPWRWYGGELWRRIRGGDHRGKGSLLKTSPWGYLLCTALDWQRSPKIPTWLLLGCAACLCWG
jgi:hypothetical protein